MTMVKSRDKVSSLDAEPWTPIAESNPELDFFFENMTKKKSWTVSIIHFFSMIMLFTSLFAWFYTTIFVVCDINEMDRRQPSHPLA